jgi:nitrogen-specific signal transduction histidine kinase
VAEVTEALTCIVSDVDRVSEVVDRIGCLIKKAPPRKEVVDLNAAVLEVAALTRSEAVKTGVTWARNWPPSYHTSNAIGCNYNR